MQAFPGKRCLMCAPRQGGGDRRWGDTPADDKAALEGQRVLIAKGFMQWGIRMDFPVCRTVLVVDIAV